MKKVLFIAFLCSVFALQAQDTLVLSHNKILEMTLSQNLEIQRNELNYKLAKASFYKNIGKAFPSLGMGVKRYELNGYTQSTTGEFVDVEKDNEWSGKSFRLSWNLSELLFNSIAQKQDVKATFYNKEANNIDEKIKIFQGYCQLAASKEKGKAISSFIQKNKEIVSQVSLQVATGLRLQSELLLAQSNLNNLKIKLLQQEQNTKELSQNLLALLNVKGNYFIKMDYDFYANDNTEINDSNLEEKLNNRFELQQLRNEVSVSKWGKRRELYGLLLPQISFGMNDGLLGPITQDAFGNQNILTTSLQWHIPLGSVIPAGNYKSKNYLYKIKLLEKEQIENDLKAEMNSLIAASNSANEQYKLAKESAKFAKLAYEQSLQRQDLGTASQLELFHAEKEYLNAKLIYIEAIAYKQEIMHQKKAAFSEKVMQ